MENNKILIVEDEEIIRLGLKDNFELENYIVETAGDGDEAIEKADSFLGSLGVYGQHENIPVDLENVCEIGRSHRHKSVERFPLREERAVTGKRVTDGISGSSLPIRLFHNHQNLACLAADIRQQGLLAFSATRKHDNGGNKSQNIFSHSNMY